MITFATSAEGDTYFLTHLYANAWKNASDDDKISALTMATKAFLLLNFVTDQVPGDSGVPEVIVDACCDEALELLNGADPAKEMASIGQNNWGFSTARVTADDKFVQPNIRAGIMSPVAWNKLIPYINSDRTLKLARQS